MAKSVFISRYLAPESIFLQRLSEAGFTVHGESLVTFKRVDFAPPPIVEWVFFYSPRGVHYFGEGLHRLDLPYPDTHYGAIGSATAGACAAAGLPVDFTGTGDPDTTAAALLPYVKDQRVLFPRARRSRRSVERALAAHITPVDLVVYDNVPRSAFELPPFDVLVFTSPLNARTYFERYPVNAALRVIAIGHPTAVTLQDLGVTNVVVSAEPSEEGLARAVLTKRES